MAVSRQLRLTQSLAAVGIQVEIIQREASSARAAVRKGKADLFLTDWYADYPDPENFTYPLVNSRNAGTGGSYAFVKDAVIESGTDLSCGGTMVVASRRQAVSNTMENRRGRTQPRQLHAADHLRCAH
jgi:ABC-type transport system substrate-binding protein